LGKNELKTFTAAIIKALCDVRVKGCHSCRTDHAALSLRLKSLAIKQPIHRSHRRH